MAVSKRIITLNIGSQQISMAVFHQTPDGGIVLKSHANSAILADPATENTRLSQVRVGIAELMEKLSISKGSDVYYAISGQATFTRFVKLPPVETADLEQLVTFEAQQHVPFPMEEIVWDWQRVESKDNSQVEVALVAIKREALDEIEEVVSSAGLIAQSIDVAPMSLYNAFRHSIDFSEETSLLIDIGAKTCNLVYMEGRGMFVRSIAVGGMSITSAISREYGISFMEAETQKCANGVVALNTVHTSTLDESIAGLATVIRNALGKLVSEISRTTNYFRSQHGGKMPTKIYLAGGGANLVCMQDFLSDKLRQPVELFNPFVHMAVEKGIDMEVLGSQAHNMGELVGLALEASGKSAVSIDLVPSDMEKRRNLKKVKPYLLIASIIFLLSLGIWAFSNTLAAHKAQQQVERIEVTRVELEKYAKPLDAFAKEQKNYDLLARQIKQADKKRVQWIDMLNELTYLFASDSIWLVDFNPVVGFKATASNQEHSHRDIQDVIQSNFASSSADKSFLTPLKPIGESIKNAENNRKLKKNRLKQPNLPTSIDAIIVRGFWRKSGNRSFGEVDNRINDLRKHSHFFDVLPNEKTKIILETGLNKKYAAPFLLILPLREPIEL